MPESSPTSPWVDHALSSLRDAGLRRGGAREAVVRWLGGQGRLACPALALLGSREAVVIPDAVRAGAARIGAHGGIVTLDTT